MKDHSSDKDNQSMVAAGSGVEPGGHSNFKYTVGGPGVGSGEVNLDQKL